MDNIKYIACISQKTGLLFQGHYHFLCLISVMCLHYWSLSISHTNVRPQNSVEYLGYFTFWDDGREVKQAWSWSELITYPGGSDVSLNHKL